MQEILITLGAVAFFLAILAFATNILRQDDTAQDWERWMGGVIYLVAYPAAVVCGGLFLLLALTTLVVAIVRA